MEKFLTVISGNDDAAVKARALALIVERLGEDYENSPDLEIVRGDEETASPEAVFGAFLNAARTPPFFGGEKTVWLRHWNLFRLLSEARAGKAVEALGERFVNEIVKAPPVEGVKLLIDGAGLDLRKTLAKTLKSAEGVELEILNPPDARSRDFARRQAATVMEEVKKAKRRIAPDAAEYLAAATGTDTLRRSSELEKLFCYVPSGEIITLEDCHAVVTADAEAMSWELGSALTERNAAAALGLVAPLMRQMKQERAGGSWELALLRSVSNAFTDIVQAHQAMAELHIPARFGPNDFSNLDPALKEAFPKNRLLTYHPYRAYKVCESAARWRPGECARALDLIVEAQRQMVSGGDCRLILEKLIVDLCRRERRDG